MLEFLRLETVGHWGILFAVVAAALVWTLGGVRVFLYQLDTAERERKSRAWLMGWVFLAMLGGLLFAAIMFLSFLDDCRYGIVKWMKKPVGEVKKDSPRRVS